jgi:DNA polymerase-3 subunit epsilon
MRHALSNEAYHTLNPERSFYAAMIIAMTTGINHRRIEDTPVAVIDFETTGVTPGYDRVVEASIVRIDPGEQPRLVFDTLVNPARPMAATEIHGISDADVSKAPQFYDIAGDLIAATKDCVIAAYNVYFDIKFLSFELSNAGVTHDPPHMCLMYLRSMLGLGSPCKLDVACRQHGVDYCASHVAAHDALAAAHLFCSYLPELRRQEVETYDDLAALRDYKFNNSFVRDPFPDPTAFGLQRIKAVVSRVGFTVETDLVRQVTARMRGGSRSRSRRLGNH